MPHGQVGHPSELAPHLLARLPTPDLQPHAPRRLRSQQNINFQLVVHVRPPFPLDIRPGDAGSSAFALGKVLGMAKGLAEVLAHELGKLDVEERGKAA